MTEKFVEINGIKVSDIGFKDLQFETSRTASGVKTIRGFGNSLNEENLSIIDTISISFVINAVELKNIAKIYQLFKACGVLPIYNEYLLKKLKSTYLKGKTKEEIENQKVGIYKDLWIKEDTEYFLCLLQKLEIHSLEKTANGFNVNMILTLFDKSLTKSEYQEYMQEYNKWADSKENGGSNFNKIVDDTLKDIKIDIFNHGDLNLKIYNVERLNQIYKEHVINTLRSNSKIKEEYSEIKNEAKQNEYYGNIRDKLLKGLDENESLEEKLKDSYTKLLIENKHILQIEMMTNNLLASIPITGSPIGYKSYLGVGDSYFNVKLIFKEEENDIVEQLKRLSDKNIIDHKIELEHPFVQLFDFYSANIVNIVFNNIEQANGIMVSIVFSLNGFKYSDESTINTESFISNVMYTDDYKQENVGGLYLELLADYLFDNEIKDTNDLYNFLDTPLEVQMFNQRGESNITSSRDTMFEASYTISDLFDSYVSYPTCIGYYDGKTKRFNDSKKDVRHYDTTKNETMYFFSEREDDLNKLFNINIQFENDVYGKDVFYINSLNNKEHFKNISVLYNSWMFMPYIDNLCGIILCGDTHYKDAVSKIFDYDNQRTITNGTNSGLEILNEVIRKLSVELFNSKANFESDELQIELSKRMYETFYIKLFKILNNNESVKDKIEQNITKRSFMYGSDKNLLLKLAYDSIEKLSSMFFDMFLNSFYDENFIGRLVEQIIEDYADPEKRIIERKEENKKFSKEKAIEFITELRMELKVLYSRNKDVIVERTYNLFLSKLIHTLYSLQMRRNINNLQYTKEQLEQYIRIFILSSSVLSILFLKSSKRTDKFENPIVLGTQNIGYKISLYNQHITRNEEDKEKIFCEFFDNFFYKTVINGQEIKKSKEYRLHYSFLENPDFCFDIGSKFNKYSVPKKDINFFYGKKLNRTDNHIKVFLSDILNRDNKEKYILCNDWIDKQRKVFLKEDKEQEDKLENYCYTETNVKDIKFPKLYFGYLPSYFSKLFYKQVNGKGFEFTNVEKERIIANSDPFKEFESLYNVVLDCTDYTIPDYDIIVSHKISNTEYSGDYAEIEEEEVNIILTNIVSINIVKNPKDKIKTANIVINNVSKSVFNFNPEESSFDIKVKRDGSVDIIKITSGDEIRVRLGHGNNKQLFNGFINKVMVNGATLVISASSFASALYAKKIEVLPIKTDRITEGDFFRAMFNQAKSALNETDEKIKNEILINSFNKGMNDFLFKFLPKVNFNKIFNTGEKASMYSASILSLGTLSSKVLNKFTKVKKGNITSAKLATDLYMKRSLQSPIGSFEFDATQNFSPMVYENLNNVDADYETYGMNGIEADNYDSFSNKFYDDQYNFKDSSKKDPYESNSEDDVASHYANLATDNFLKKDEVKNEKKEQYVKPTVDDIKPLATQFETQSGVYSLDCYPVNLSKDHKITSLYYEDRSYGKHKGLDIGIQVNKRNNFDNFAIYCPRDGVVIDAGRGSSTGKFIKIKHKFTNKDGKEDYFVSKYYHLDAIKVKKGDQLKAKDPIGVMGNTGGTSTGLHLHFELTCSDGYTRINPFNESVLPEPVGFNLSDIISWSEVGRNADNGRYREDPVWKEKYKKGRG